MDKYIYSGIILTSLLDYPGNISSIVFTRGCNARCGYCQNGNIVMCGESEGNLNGHMILEKLISRKRLINHVVITGGEPAIHDFHILDFMKALKENGFYIKLDTNGFHPFFLKVALQNKYVDYIAMDIKAPLITSKYSKVTQLNLDWSDISKRILNSISIICNSDIDYEFRTTVVESYHSFMDLKSIALLRLPNHYFQQFRPNENMFDKSLCGYTDNELKYNVEYINSKYNTNILLRGIK